MRPRLLLLALTTIPAAMPQECATTPLTPAQPPIEVKEGESAIESPTFQTTALWASPTNVVYFFDTAARIRRIDNGRMVTVAGNGTRADSVGQGGPARQIPLAGVTQILFPKSGVPHFVSVVNGVGRVFRIAGERVEPVAGSARPGFNGESGPALEVNLGSIVNTAFAADDTLLILDGFARLRRLESDGTLRTIAGSATPAAAAGFTGDNGPAVNASLSSPRQVFPLPDGTIWIKDLTGRHLRAVSRDGIIRTINQNFETSVTILPLADGSPSAATANRVYPIRSNGLIETGGNPYPAFTGTPLSIGPEGSLYFLGNARPEQRNPLLRISNRVQTVIAGAPVAPTVPGQAPALGIWHPRTGALIYSTALDNKTGLVEARAGQRPRFIVGGGDDTGDVDGKDATAIATFGILAFSVDGEGRIVVADVNRRRIFVVGSDNKVAVLKSGGAEIVYAPTGSLSSLQRIAADNAGNVYWFSQGATPTGGVFTAEITAWTRATQSVSNFLVVGLSALARLEDGSVAAIAGNGANFRSVYPLTPAGQGAALSSFRFLPLVSVARWRGRPYFTAASRLFRGDPGDIEYLDLPALASGATFTPDFLIAAPDALVVHSAADGGFHRFANPDACTWQPQPRIEADGIVNSASFGFANTMSPRQLLTIFGRGLGPGGGQGLVLDGLLRAGGQPPPYPALLLGNFSGANPNATLTGTAMPVVYSDDSQVTVQAPAAVSTTGTYLLYYSWQGLQLIHPTPVASLPAAPGLFTREAGRSATVSAVNEDGSRHGEGNPAAGGSVVQMFGTGLGTVQTNPALGDVFSLTAAVDSTLAVTATVGGEEAEVVFAGGAAGQLGVWRIDVRIPEGLEPGEHAVVVTAGGQSTRAQHAVVHVR